MLSSDNVNPVLVWLFVNAWLMETSSLADSNQMMRRRPSGYKRRKQRVCIWNRVVAHLIIKRSLSSIYTKAGITTRKSQQKNKFLTNCWRKTWCVSNHTWVKMMGNRVFSVWSPMIGTKTRKSSERYGALYPTPMESWQWKWSALWESLVTMTKILINEGLENDVIFRRFKA